MLSRRSESGQMAVELAVLLPVAIVVGLVAYNLMRFVGLCAAFDRVALDAVVSQGVAPSGAQGEWASVAAVRSAILESIGNDHVEVEVSASQVSSGDAAGRGTISFPISPLLTEFHCTLRYRPWPTSFSLAGVDYGSPLVLTHTRTLVVDRFRPGVVV